jgi:ferrous iron transport protein A
MPEQGAVAEVKNRESLTDMKKGCTGRVADIIGGYGLTRRLEAFGIRPGATLRKVSGFPLHGPVVVILENEHIALGFGMARKIILEVK